MKILLIGLCMLGEMGPDCLNCTDFCEAGDSAGWKGSEAGSEAWEAEQKECPRVHGGSGICNGLPLCTMGGLLW